MNTTGKVCLGITLAGMIAWIYLAGRLGNYANTWAVKLRDAKATSEKSSEERTKNTQDLKTAQAELARIKMGWGYEWDFPKEGNLGSVQVAGGKLAVTGIGRSNGLEPRTVDRNGQPFPVPPSVHLFIPNGQGGSTYLGEFVADPQQLGPTNAVLSPTWFVTPQEIQTWNFSQGVRLRSQVPPAERAGVEGVNQQLQRARELFAETSTAIADQQALLTAAQKQLDGRKGELLGNPEMPLIADRPEHTVGLVKALENLEEDRNAAQLVIDKLRRGIKAAADARTLAIATLNELAAKLPKPNSQVSQLPR